MGPIALTGATGFLGGHLVDAFLAAGLPVRGVVRRPERARALTQRGVALAPADLADVEALTLGFLGAEVVVANAALGSYLGTLEDFVRANVGGAEHTLRAAAAAGVRRVVWISSTGVYRTRVWRRMGEDAERYGPVRRASWSDLTTDWRYALTKHLAEERATALAAELGVALTVLRPGPIYGSRDSRWTARFLRAHARRFVVAPTIGVPMVHAGDVARVVVAAVERPALAGRVYNVAGPPVSVVRVLRVLRRLTGRGPFVVPIPVPLWVRYDTTAAERDLGFEVRPLEDGLLEVLHGG